MTIAKEFHLLDCACVGTLSKADVPNGASSRPHTAGFVHNTEFVSGNVQFRASSHIVDALLSALCVFAKVVLIVVPLARSS
jgi:hypothetical protein